MADSLTPHLDLAGYVLGTLTPAEVSAFEIHLAGCAECAAEFAELASLPSILANAVPGPPAALRQRTLNAIAAAANPGPVDRVPAADDLGAPTDRVRTNARSGSPAGSQRPAQRPGTPRSPSAPARPSVVTPLRPRRTPGIGWLATGAAAVTVVVAVVVGAILLGNELSAPSRSIPLAAVEGGPGRGEAMIHRVSSGHEIRLEVSGLPASPPGTYYECWFVGPSDNQQAPSRMSVGTFTVGDDGTAAVVWISAADLTRFPNMGITLEPADGNPDANGPKILAGP